MKTEKLLKELDKATENVHDQERVLYLLLELNKKHITGLVESDPGYFHKAFRQTDVTDSGFMDSAIWILMSKAKIFWEVFAKLEMMDESEFGKKTT